MLLEPEEEEEDLAAAGKYSLIYSSSNKIRRRVCKQDNKHQFFLVVL